MNIYTSFTILRQNWMQINIINNTFLIIYVAGPDIAFRNQVCELCWIDERGKCGWNERWQLHTLRHRNLRFTNHFKCCTLLTGIHCIHYAVYSDLHNVILYLTSCTVHTHDTASNTVLLLVILYCTLVKILHVLVVLVISPLGFREDLHGHYYVFCIAPLSGARFQCGAIHSEHLCSSWQSCSLSPRCLSSLRCISTWLWTDLNIDQIILNYLSGCWILLIHF